MDFIKIASAQNKQLKYGAQLQKKNRFRNEEGKIVLEGFHLLQEIIKTDKSLIDQVFICSKQLQNPEVKVLNEVKAPLYVLHNDLINKLSSTHNSTGLVTIARKPEPKNTENHFVCFIENLQDPGNLGTIIRSGAAAGIEQIILDKQSVDPWSSKVLRAGMGSHFKVNIKVTDNLEKSITDFRGTTYATTLGGENLFNTKLNKKSAFIIGNEGQGLSEKIQSQAHSKILIPMKHNVESLNAGTAATICFYEYFRQHLD